MKKSDFENLKITKELIGYISVYVLEELNRGSEISFETIYNAIEAFEGGAR